MFTLNKEILTKKTHPEEYAWMEKKFDEIRKEGKKSIVFKAYENNYFNQDADSGRLIKRSRLKITPQEVMIYNKEMEAMQNWAYAPNMSGFKNEHGSFELKSKGMKLLSEEVFNVDSKDIEVIFFLRYLSQDKTIKEIDLAKDNKQKAEALMDELEARTLIFSKRSPIHPENIGSEAPLRNIAISWGVSGTESIDIYTVMDDLWNRVQFSQNKINSTGRGYSQFIEEVLKVGDGSKRTTVILGIQKGVLKYKDNVWYLSSKGGAEVMLVGVAPGTESTKDEQLVKYLVGSDRHYEMVELAVKDGSNALVVEELSKGETLQDLRAECRNNLGWPSIVINKKSKDELQRIVEEREKYVQKA